MTWEQEKYIGWVVEMVEMLEEDENEKKREFCPVTKDKGSI